MNHKFVQRSYKSGEQYEVQKMLRSGVFDPRDLIGHFVQIKFKTENTYEYMWIAVEKLLKVDNDLYYTGRLDNQPVRRCDYELNDKVQFNSKEIVKIVF